MPLHHLSMEVLAKRAVLATIVALLMAGMGFATDSSSKPRFRFREAGYFHRWSGNEQHEFTPEKQEDLEKWTDMITVNGYPDVGDGESLAARANAVLENYKSHQAMVLKTSSVPASAGRPAEHFIAVVFGRPKFIEVAFARLKLVGGAGASVVYSHRIYGEKIGDEMSAWLSANGPAAEMALLEWNSFPSPASLRQEMRQTKI